MFEFVEATVTLKCRLYYEKGDPKPNAPEELLEGFWTSVIEELTEFHLFDGEGVELVSIEKE